VETETDSTGTFSATISAGTYQFFASAPSDQFGQAVIAVIGGTTRTNQNITVAISVGSADVNPATARVRAALKARHSRKPAKSAQAAPAAIKKP
jgi:hypothetical protein